MSVEIIEDRAAFERQNYQQVITLSNGEVCYPDEWDYEIEPDEVFIDEEYLARRQIEMVDLAPSDFVEFAIKIPNKEKHTWENFSFAQRRYLKQIYDTPSRKTLLKCGRQVEKSTLLGNKLLAYSCIIPALNCLYVSPTNQQTVTFSRDRLKEPIDTSDFLKSWTTTKLSDNVFLKKFINRSQIVLRYAFLNADRTRGIPADVICLDEVQDLLTDNIPVIEQCASHSHLKIFMYSGTPKSLDNPLEKYWIEQSTQNEWAVPCHRHTIASPIPGLTVKVHWNILGEEHMGLNGLICDKCGGPINPADDRATWVSMNARIKEDPEIKNPFEGYRIPQLMVPWTKWEDMIQYRATYPRPKLYNEVLGLSYDSGTRPLRQQDLQDNCIDKLLMSPTYLKRLRNTVGDAIPIFCGIDWGAGTEKAFTVLTLGGYLENKFTLFYWHRFEGPEIEPEAQMRKVCEIIDEWRPQYIGVDYGGGFHPNDELIRKYGFLRIVKYQYSTPRGKVVWMDEGKRFLVNRTEVMSDMFNAIKRRNVFRFPKWDHFKKPFGDDMLNIFSEYNEVRRMDEYKKSPDTTDDSFHALVYCFLASMLVFERKDVITPTAHSGDSSYTPYHSAH